MNGCDANSSSPALKMQLHIRMTPKNCLFNFSRLIPDRGAETKIRVREGASKTDGGSGGKKIVEERERETRLTQQTFKKVFVGKEGGTAVACCAITACIQFTVL